MTPTQPLRPYQTEAVTRTYTAWQTGKRRVLCVAPTGAGKTRLAEEFVWRAAVAGERSLFIVHRRELLRQAAERLAPYGAGIIAPGEDQSPFAPVQVATVQTLLARDIRPEASLIVLDEAHHYVSDDWSRLAEAYPHARALGLTATPERQDGRPLGDVFDELIAVAKYSELLRDGFLVPCRVFQPPEMLDGDLAADPLEAWQRHAPGEQTFAFLPNLKIADEQCERFNAAGIPSRLITAKTKKRDRDEALDGFSSGAIRVLFNYNVLTEGVDVPAARCCLIGRSFQHQGAYLQAAGRVLRPHPSKPDAIIIDLTGATLRHGFPTDDRIYSLSGAGITRDSITPLRQCLECGATLPAALMQCTECGYVFPKRDPRVPRIYSLELREVFSGASTPDEAKVREYQRLRQLGKDRGWSLYFVQKEYKKLFGEIPVILDASPEEMRTEYARLTATQQQRGFKPGFVKVRFKEMFGRWPGREVHG